MKKENYYLGLDIGTDSVGYAATDKEYNLLKFHGEPVWGVTVFDEAALSAERRAFRSARRRLDRRQQRVILLQELFAKEVSKVDERFFVRIKESSLYRDEVGEKFTLFNDENYTDKDYHNQYPTIHHLICDLIKNKKPHDVRLVYLACAWLLAHRGHFLNNIDKNNLESIKNFDVVYDNFMAFFSDKGFSSPWEKCDKVSLANALESKLNITSKNKELIRVLYDGKKPSRISAYENEDLESFPFNRDCIVKLLAGGTVKLKDLFYDENYDEFGSVSLGMDDDKLAEIMSNIGDDYDLIAAMRMIYDWSVLIDVLGDYSLISEAKVKIYEQHKEDLKFLKYFIKKYFRDNNNPQKYDEVFRVIGKDNYAAYVYHIDKDAKSLKKKGKEEFSKFILGIIKDVKVEDIDKTKYDDMLSRLELRTFMPKQKDTDNRVIPHQLYWYELHNILKNASAYLSFLNEKDEDGISIADKVESIFLFRIPYFVGPLNSDSERAWIVKKGKGKIYPWNFDKMVDLDASEQEFIKKMTNTCTYLPGEPVLPKDSLLYHKFMVLNEINNITINGQRISVDLKQRIFNEVFLSKKNVTRKFLVNYLVSNNEITKGEEDAIGGIDEKINSNLAPQIAFRRMLESGIMTEKDVERIIERASYAEDKSRLAKWLKANYMGISEEDRKYICSMKFKDFGRLSREFLNGIEGIDKHTGELTTIIGALWNSQNNLMEIIADKSKYTFAEEIESFQSKYYSEHKLTLEDRLDDMYISNSVRRPIYRTLDIVKDIVKAFGEPERIFIEMTRGASPDKKGKRTKSRKQQILELYSKCKDEDVKHLKEQLESMGEYADNKLQGDKLFLYYMQLGKSMYSGKPIFLEKLGTKAYDIDHIYPQAFVKDDSILNNKVLVLSEENGKKSNNYPIEAEIRDKMKGYWDYLKDIGLITPEKHKRLVRNTGFSTEEKYGFINRQLTETSQSTKAVATLLNERYPNAEIVYCKAKLASEFRHEFDLYKSRSFNDLHHAVDAYLNIVTGNVYNMKFTKKWFSVDSDYSIKTRTIFEHPVMCGKEMVWDGGQMLAKVKKNATKNTAHFTKYAFYKKGGLFDQMPVSAAKGLTPLKKNLPTEKYGGYNKAGAMFYIPVRYKAGKKTEIIIMSVEMLYGERFLKEEAFAKEYSFARLKHIIGKDVEEVSFPMGMRPWKVNTCLSLDGFMVCIAGISSGGKCLVAQPIVQFSADKEWNYYLKKIEEFVKKITANDKYIYDKDFDKISKDKNEELYELYIEKYKNSIYSKRINSPLLILEEGKAKFKSLDIKSQSRVLLSIHQTFGRIAGGVDLTPIGGAGKAAATISFSSTISNWAKTYHDVRIVDASPSGIWKKKSQNLLELL